MAISKPTSEMTGLGLAAAAELVPCASVNPALDVLWKEHFRVTRTTFENLCNFVRADLQKQHTRMQSPVSVKERVGLALRRIATGNSFRSCGLQFGLGKSTAKKICGEF